METEYGRQVVQEMLRQLTLQLSRGSEAHTLALNESPPSHAQHAEIEVEIADGAVCAASHGLIDLSAEKLARQVRTWTTWYEVPVDVELWVLNFSLHVRSQFDGVSILGTWLGGLRWRFEAVGVSENPRLPAFMVYGERHR